MIVVAIIALLASIAVPGFLRARKRSQASRIINDLRLIDNAVDMYAIENNKATGNPVNVGGLDQVHQSGHQSLPHRQGYFGQHLWQSDRGFNSKGANLQQELPLGRDRLHVLVTL